MNIRTVQNPVTIGKRPEDVAGFFDALQNLPVCAAANALRGKQTGTFALASGDIRAQRLQLLATVVMPLEGLSIDEAGELIFRGQRWDCMSGAEQLQVSAAICAAMKPECGFVLLDRLECMDVETLREFGG